MEYFLIIVVLILLVGGKSAKSIKAFRQELSDLENSTETPQPAFESLFKTAKPEKRVLLMRNGRQVISLMRQWMLQLGLPSPRTHKKCPWQKCRNLRLISTFAKR